MPRLCGLEEQTPLTDATADRLSRQIDFLVLADRLKDIFRQTVNTKTRRQENDAEHSWHLALMSLILYEYLDEKGVNLLKVMKMLLIHDLVEIFAGDTFCYDVEGVKGQLKRENGAAEKMFPILPSDQAKELRALWDEFVEMKTPEARYAAALDRLQPLLLNYNTEGHAWKKHGIRKPQVLERNKHIEKASKRLWTYARGLIDSSVEKGYLEDH
jgi:putative hydrolase of HD superfamily